MSSTPDDRRERLRQKITLTIHGDNRIYGRSGEESILINSYYASLTLNQNSPANLILIRGDSGLGKTKLAELLRPYAREDDGFFIRGKFDLSSASGAANVPYSGITNAFREYCSLLHERGEDRDQMVKALKREIHENDGSILCEAIPSLRNIFRDNCSGEYVDELASSKNRLHRLNYLLKKFIRVISSTGDPIIFLLDDMQWSDQGSLDLLKILARSAKSPCLFIFTYRPVPADHPFMQFIDSLETKNSVTEVSLRGLSQPDVHQMVSGILGTKQKDSSCLSLSDFLCRVTNGNPLLVRQQLISLLDDGLIYYEGDTDNLVWDMHKIQESNMVSSNLTSTTLYKFKRLPVETQTALKICACIGSTIDLDVLGTLAREICQDDDVHYNAETSTKQVGKDCILSAILEGLLTESCDGTAVSFIHDSVQSAAYSLLQAHEQTAFHLRIGLILKTNITATTPTDYVFTVANQLARGRAHVQEDERIEVARVFLRAGEESSCSCAFREAHYFYGQAIQLFCNSDWIQDYMLVRDAYLNASEAALWSGAHEDGCAWLEIVSTRTKGSLMDQLNVLWVQVNLISSKGDLHSAIDFGLKELGSLVGVKVSQTNLKARTMVAMVRSKRLMRDQTELTLLERPRMICEKISAALRILNFLALLCAASKPRLVPLICFKIVELNMRHGISRFMPTAVAWYGVIYLYAGFPISDAAKYGHIALGLQEALKCHECKAQVAALCHGMIFTFVNPSECVKPLHNGYLAGLQSGDVRNAMICAQCICVLSFYSGQQLSHVASTLVKFSSVMREFNTSTVLGVNLVYEQVIEKLTGRLTSSRDIAVLKGEIFNIGVDCSKTPMENEHACMVQMMLAYFLDDYDLAWSTSNKLVRIPRPATLLYFCAAFYRCMTALALMQTNSSNKKALKKVAKSCRKTIKKISEKSPINFKMHQELIEAEWAVSRRKFDLAEKCFSLSIELGSRFSVTHFEALAWERFGHHYLIRGNKDLGYEHLRRAHKLYSQWGARLKSELMEKKYKDLLA